MKKNLLTIVVMALIAIGAQAQAIVAEIDWTQRSEYLDLWYSDLATVTVEQGNGLIIDCAADGTGNYWEPQVPILGHIPTLEDGVDYLLMFTLNSPVSGELRLDLCSWDGTGATYSKIIEVAAGETLYTVEFENYPTDCEDAMIFFQCGKLPGTHIISNVYLYNNLAYIENWTVAGDEKLLGANWDVTDIKNKMMPKSEETYTLKKTDLKLSKGTYEYKVYKDNSTQESYPNSNASLMISEDGVYDVEFTFNTNTKELSATATRKEGWSIAGDESLLGSDWDPTKNKMETSDGESYTLTRTGLGLPKGTYEYKVYKDFSTQESYPSSNASLVIEEDAIYAVNFTFNINTKEVSATATKTDGFYFNFIKKGKIAELKQNPNKYKGNIIIPATVTHEGEEYSVKKIADNAFNGCSSLTSITIPNSVTTIGSGAFEWCSGLTSVTIPNSVTSIGEYAFYGCTGLTSIMIPNSVTSLGNSVFSGCTRLTSVTIPNSVTIIGTYSFSGCEKLKSITIPNSVTSIGGSAFASCSCLTSITIPNSVMSIESRAFSGCSSLSSVTIGNNVTSIGNYAFQGCSSLSSVTIGNSVTSIGSYAFQGCSSLSSVTIPNSVTYIYQNAFSGCTSLTSITIGNGVNSIEGNAFAQCSNITDVFCMAENVPSTSTSAFVDSYVEYATLHVSASAINSYKTIAPWSGFGEIVAISGEAIVTPKCATPTITFENGKIKFNCETEGAEFVSEITTVDTKKYYDSEITPTYKYKVSVYATKAGYENSDTATAEFTATGKVGDVNGDNEITVTDALMIVDEILKNK